MRPTDLDKLITFHTELNPKLWYDNNLRREVRYKLLLIAKEFVKFINIPDFTLQDITISGSNCSYNYNDQSDIDLHLVVDSDSPCWPHLNELYLAKKTLFNDQHDIKLRDIDVEVYVQDSKQPHISNGIFSVLNDEWLKQPRMITADVDETNVADKYKSLKFQIQIAVASEEPRKLRAMQDKVKRIRKSGLAKHGEFGPENLVFKLLRNDGTLDELYAASAEAQDKHLSLPENFADGKGPGRPGDSQRHGIPKGATMSQLEKASHAKGRKGQLARWQLNMRRGHKKESVDETRDAAFAWIKSKLPKWPDYVLRDWIYNSVRGDFGPESVHTEQHLRTVLAGEGMDDDTQWQLVPNFKFSFQTLNPWTVNKIKARWGGESDMGMGIPKDAERHATQAALAQQQGGVRKEPVILKKIGNQYELIEGWHRTIQHFKQFPDGFVGPAWVAMNARPVSEAAESVVAEKWSQKYKRSIDCSHPKGFSQKAHCAGRKKTNEVTNMTPQAKSVDETKNTNSLIREPFKNPVGVLKKYLDKMKSPDWDKIDLLMKRIANRQGIGADLLHKMWVDKYNKTPDTYCGIKKKKVDSKG